MSAVLAIERHKSGNPHAHALLRFPGGLPDTLRHIIQTVFTESGGWCKLEKPRSQGDTLEYVTKYVAKDGDLYFTPNFRPVMGQPSLDFDQAN